MVRKAIISFFMIMMLIPLQATAVIVNANPNAQPSGFIPFDFNQARVKRYQARKEIREYDEMRRSVWYQRERYRKLSAPDVRYENTLLLRELNSGRNGY